MTERIVFDIGRPLIMAHRGESENAPENTMLALESAVAIGVDVLESDVQITKDDEVVLFHDETLLRTTGLEGTIRSHTLDELRQIDFGRTFTSDGGTTFPFRGKGHSIVTLTEAFEHFPNIIFNLDIKDTFQSAPAELARLISQTGRSESVIVASFHDIQIERFRELMPKIPTTAHPGEVKKFVLNTKFGLPRIKSDDIHYKSFAVPMKSGPLKVTTKKFVRKAHEHNIAVHVWTINDSPTMNSLIDLGVDGIFTDNPRILKEVLQTRGLL
ncbi:glycerophosphodiester phosphodiesterase [Candidatus Thorarchaeota archaeon]|nr:MAG: glycerophosphodiester phosphodiesterase [Candidatus Thorarchaeota archaeon]